MRPKEMRLRALAAACFTLLAAFTVVPIAALIFRSTGDDGWFATWASSEALWALRGTVLTSTGAAVIAFVLGLPLALLIERTNLHGARAIKGLLTLPSAIPPYVWAMGWVALANPRAGLLNLAFGASTFDIYGASGMAFVLGISALPLVVLPAGAALARIDSSLEEAARLSGASVGRTLATVSLPLALPAALSGAALVFLYSASSFGVPYILGVTGSPPTPTLTTRLYGEVLMGPGGLHRASILSVELLVMAVAVLLVSAWFSRTGRVRLSLGKGLTVRPMPLGAANIVCTTLISFVIIVVIVMPLMAVFMTSVQPTWGELRGFTFRHWSAVLTNARTLAAAIRSLWLSAAAAALVALFGLLIGVTRRKWLETFGDAIFAVPGTVFALALIVTFSRDLRFIAFEHLAFVLALGNTLTLLLIAYVAKHLAYGIRNVSDSLSQLDPSLGEAARLSGAGPLRAFLDAVLPQLRRPIIAAFMLTFLTCMTELTVSVLLVPSGTEVLGTLVFELQSYADPAAAAVIACMFIIMVVTAMVMIEFIGRSSSKVLTAR